MIWLHTLLLAPIILEAGYDNLFWAFGKSDKPHSTLIFRPVIMALCGFIAMKDFDLYWWQVYPTIILYFGLFFPLLINWTLSRSWGYVSPTTNKWSYDYWVAKIPTLFYLWLRIWGVILGVCLVYYYNLANLWG